MCDIGLPGLDAQCSTMRFGSLLDGSPEMAESEHNGGGRNYAKYKQSFAVANRGLISSNHKTFCNQTGCTDKVHSIHFGHVR